MYLYNSINNTFMKPKDFFSAPSSVAQKQYEALRMCYVEGVDAATVAARFGYTRRGLTTIASGFIKKLVLLLI